MRRMGSSLICTDRVTSHFTRSGLCARDLVEQLGDDLKGEDHDAAPRAEAHETRTDALPQAGDSLGRVDRAEDAKDAEGLLVLRDGLHHRLGAVERGVGERRHCACDRAREERVRVLLVERRGRGEQRLALFDQSKVDAVPDPVAPDLRHNAVVKRERAFLAHDRHERVRGRLVRRADLLHAHFDDLERAIDKGLRDASHGAGGHSDGPLRHNAREQLFVVLVEGKLGCALRRLCKNGRDDSAIERAEALLSDNLAKAIHHRRVHCASGRL
eukprot:Amastigsp_a883645_9.p2 type:complete len:271 gc:universal Amastigsp_a883645_9:56-868(+)